MMERFTGGTAEGRVRVISEEPIGPWSSMAAKPFSNLRRTWRVLHVLWRVLHSREAIQAFQ